jgi:flavin reductase ActVB
VTTADSALRFREVLARFPSGVTIVTTQDRMGVQWGFTASSFCSVSMDPPLVLVCLARSAECHQAFVEAHSWNIHVVGAQHHDLAYLFATKGADKFNDGWFERDEYGNPLLSDACAVLHCNSFSTHETGDHTILVGRVVSARLGDSAPTVYFQRGFHSLAEAPVCT